MSNQINFLLNTNTNVGIKFYLDLSILSKKDSINEYYENKIIIQFYCSDLFFLIYKKRIFKGVLFGLPSLNSMKIRNSSFCCLTQILNGIFLVFENLEQFGETCELLFKFKEFRNNYQKLIEAGTILCYLVDRKKKKIENR